MNNFAYFIRNKKRNRDTLMLKRDFLYIDKENLNYPLFK